jgi:hypothetical protein
MTRRVSINVDGIPISYLIAGKGRFLGAAA